jgi:hypothetical protein
MKLHWLAVVLVVGVFLVGCTPERPQTTLPPAPTAPTAQTALQNVDKAMADLEKALAGTDKDAMMGAARLLDVAVGGLRGQLAAKDDAAALKAHQASTEAPPAISGQLGPATEAAGSMMGAVSATPPDVARAKTLLAQVKSAVDAVRKDAQ